MKDFTAPANAITPATLFISWGEQVKMYTLRVMYSHKVEQWGQHYVQIVDSYITNLSTDSSKAIEKAKARAVEWNMPVDISGAKASLNEIVRRERSTVEANQKAEQEAYAKYLEQQQREEQQAREAAMAKVVEMGVFQKGKYTGSTPKEVYDNDFPYLMWASKAMDEGHKQLIAHSGLIPAFTNEWFGEEGDKVDLELRLIERKYTNGRFQTIMFKAITPENHRVIFFSTAKAWQDLEIHDKFSITGTIKTHDSYCGENSTVIQRPKMVK